MTQLTRRQWLTGAAATAGGFAAGCRPRTAPGTSRDLYTKLDGIRFATADGQIVTIDDLETTLGSKNTVLAFGWNGCDQYCPHTNVTLAELQNRFGNGHRTVVINVKPEADYIFAPLHTQTLESMGVHNPLVLFPVDSNGRPSNAEAIRAQTAMGAIVDQREPERHTPYIHLFDRNGHELNRVVGTDAPYDVADALAPHMQAGHQR